VPAPAPAGPRRADRRSIGICALGIALTCVCVLAAHWPALSAKALCSDDLEYLVDNPLVQKPSWHSAKLFLTEVLRPSTVGGYYQPLAMISLMLDYAAGGREANPRALHRTSLALHVANSALVVILIYLLFGNPWIATIVGLLFGLHPMTVEPIPWISERKTLLASLFAFACLALYVRYVRTRSWKYYLAVAATFVLALMSKPTSTPLPACMLLMDYWPLRRLDKRAVLEKIPLFVIAGVSAFITFYSQRATFGVHMPSKRSPLWIFYVICHNIVFYLYKILIPVNLSPHYPYPKPVGISHPMVLIGVIGTFVLVGVLILALKWTRAPLASWLFFFVAIFPTMGVIGFTVVIASDKFAYLPSVGLLMLLAAALAWLWDRRRAYVRWSVVAVVCAVAAAEAAGVRKTISHWRDTHTLNLHMLSLTPDSAWVHNCTAVNLIRKGRVAEAEKHLRTAIRLDPTYAEPHNSMGYIYVMRGDYDMAIKHYARAIKLRPNYTVARRNLASALAAKKRREAGRNQAGK